MLADKLRCELESIRIAAPMPSSLQEGGLAWPGRMLRCRYPSRLAVSGGFSVVASTPSSMAGAAALRQHFDAKAIVKICGTAKVSQFVFAKYLNTSTSIVQSRNGKAGRLLQAVKKHGLDVLA